MTSAPPTPEPCEVYEIDDILVTRLVGDFTLEVVIALQPRTNALANRYGYRLLLIDVQRLGAVTPAARRFIVQDQDRERKDGSLAVVGASFAIRTLVTMLITAVAKLTNLPVALKFFETEGQALAWLEQERIRLRTAGVSTKLN